MYLMMTTNQDNESIIINLEVFNVFEPHQGKTRGWVEGRAYNFNEPYSEFARRLGHLIDRGGNGGSI